MCAVNYYSDSTAVNCIPCVTGKYTNKKAGSASCSDCPAGTAGIGCIDCLAGKYRGTLDDAANGCLDCDVGQHTTKKAQPFCLDCDVGSYQSTTGAVLCVDCLTGFYQDEKAAHEACTRCIEEGTVANDQRSGCIARPEDPNAAIVDLQNIKVVSIDGKMLELTFSMKSTETATSLTTIERGDRLELTVSTRADLKKDATYILYDLTPNSNSQQVEAVILVRPIPQSSTMKNNVLEEITGLGSAWEQLRYFTAKVVKDDSGGTGRRGPQSSRNDAWLIADSCGDGLFLRTHPNDDLTLSPLPLHAGGSSELPSCVPCPGGANCRGSRTWSQVESLPGYRPLPWDDRGYGKCPRPPACPGSDEMMLQPASTFDLNGGNSTREVETCNGGHRGILCGECNHWFDTRLGDNLGLCVDCPDQTENYWRFGALAVVGVLMMTFLVGDSLAGIRKIVTGVAQGDDIAMPFHSVGIRIISSYMQVAGLLNNFRLELPEAVTTLITAQSAASGVGGAVISFNCLFPETRGAELFVTRLVVIVIVLVS